MEPEIVSRKDWGAVTCYSRQRVTLPVENVIYYYANTRYQQCYTMEACKKAMFNMQRMHLNRLHMPDIAFNFVVAGDGRIYEGRGWHHYPAKFRYIHHMNKKAYLIGVMGDMKDTPSEKLWDATWRILEIAYRKNYVTKDVYLACEDTFEANVFLKSLESEIREPIADSQEKIKNLAVYLKPSIDPSQFWKDSPDLPITSYGSTKYVNNPDATDI